MCYGCWQEYGAPEIDTPQIREVAELVNTLYETECAGGMLHVQLDDWNLEDDLWDDPFSERTREIYERGPNLIEYQIAALMKEMTLEQRASVMALADGYLE